MVTHRRYYMHFSKEATTYFFCYLLENNILAKFKGLPGQVLNVNLTQF